MKLLKFAIFLSILGSIFLMLYRNSNNKGLRILWISFRTPIVIALILAGVISEGAEATEPSVNNSQVVHERLVSNQEFNSLNENDQQVILAKAQPRNFLFAPPSRSVPGVNPYQTVDQGLGGGRNAEFDDNCPVPKKDRKIELVYRIKENPVLVREAERAGRDQDAQRSLNNLVEQLSLGNENPGIGTEHVFKNVYELRGKNRARVYYREVDGKIEILGKSVKSNQQKVINILKKMYD